MKKNIIILLLCVVTLTVNAQTKVTKSSILGKWEIAFLKNDGLMSYDYQNDSFILISEKLQRFQKNYGDSGFTVIGKMKESLAKGKKMVYNFNSNNSYAITDLSGRQTDAGTYSIDEMNETITFKTNTNQLVKYKFYSKNNRLVLELGNEKAKIISEFVKI
jgi:hypothetical protein